MRLTNLMVAATSLLLHSTITTAASFKPVELDEPLNWTADDYLFPGNVIAGYNANLTEYNATTWGTHVLAACMSFTACTSALAFEGMMKPREQHVTKSNEDTANNSGDTGGRFWFGYAFRGGPTDQSFYEREDDPHFDVKNSAAWTIVE